MRQRAPIRCRTSTQGASPDISRQGAKLAKIFQNVIGVQQRTLRVMPMLRTSLCFFLASWREQFPGFG